MLVIGVMNGAFSSVRDTDNPYMSDVVEDLIKRMKITNYAYTFFKGSMWDDSSYEMKHWLTQYDKNENNLLYIGKSAGGWRAGTSILKDFIANSLFNKQIGIMVDATYPFRFKKLSYRGFNKLINIYQSNGFLHGDRCIIENSECELQEYEITDKGVDHFNIIYNKLVEDNIRKSISELS